MAIFNSFLYVYQRVTRTRIWWNRGHGWIDGGCFQGWLRRRRPSTKKWPNQWFNHLIKTCFKECECVANALRMRCECVAIRILHVLFMSYLIMKCWRTVLFATHTKHTPKVRAFKTKRETNERHTHELPMNYPNNYRNNYRNNSQFFHPWHNISPVAIPPMGRRFSP